MTDLLYKYEIRIGRDKRFSGVDNEDGNDFTGHPITKPASREGAPYNRWSLDHLGICSVSCLTGNSSVSLITTF